MTSVPRACDQTTSNAKSRIYSGNNRRGGVKITEGAHPLVRRFMDELNEQKTTFQEVAEKSGVGVDTLRFWQTRHMPRLDTFEAALNAIGYKLKIVAT